MWNTVSLSDVCNVSIGKTPPRGDKRYWDKEKRTNNVWLSIADLSSSNDKYVSNSKEYLSNEGASLFKSVPKNKLDELLEKQTIKRFGEFKDVSNTVDYLIKPESEFITGQIIYFGGVS